MPAAVAVGVCNSTRLCSFLLLQGYLPRDLYQLDSCYGSEGDLRDLINKCHEYNIKVIADIVVNHRCGSHAWPVHVSNCRVDERPK